jgi:hypothetical protein
MYNAHKMVTKSIIFGEQRRITKSVVLFAILRDVSDDEQ